MKVLQLNIWSGKLDQHLKSLLNREEADILCLQEVISVAGGQSLFFLDLESIQKQCGYEYAYHTPAFSFKYMQRTAYWGNAIFSKHPIKRKKDIYTYQELAEDFDFLDNDNYNTGRSLQHAVIEVEDKEYNILNHHGYHNHHHKNGDDETLRQCRLISEYARELGNNVILCGDFNLVPNSASLQLISEILLNHTKKQGIATTRTSLTSKTEVCDYIFTSPSMNTKNFQVLEDIVSDHKALTIEF